MELKYKKSKRGLQRISTYGGKAYYQEVKQDKKDISSKSEKIKSKMNKLRKRLNEPLIKGGKRTSLGGGRVRVSAASGIKGFFRWRKKER